VARRRSNRRTSKLFKFDVSYLERYHLVAGVDEAGRGPLAGPVVAAAVILPSPCRIPTLNDSKQLSEAQRNVVYRTIQRVALAIGVGIVDAAEIDRVNIRQASFAAMRLALSRLIVKPIHVMVDGFRIPDGPTSQTGIVAGDTKSAHIAAASIIAKVTRDALMVWWDARFPAYGFKHHKGYGTTEHFSALERFGPCPIHRRSYAPVRLAKELGSLIPSE
jgi:ribonuclease HII